METLYQRQRPLELAIPTECLVVGLGGVGTYVALLLAMSGVSTLHLFDSDTLTITNCNRLPYPITAIGQTKTSLAGSLVLSLRPSIHIHQRPHATLLTLALAGGQFLFDCTDRWDTQTMLRDWSQEHHVHYIRAGCDGTHVTVTDTLPWSQGNAPQGYQTAPSWVVPCVLVAALAVAKALKFPDFHTSTDIGNLHNDIAEGGQNARNNLPGNNRRLARNRRQPT